jgi:hypothetical protein
MDGMIYFCITDYNKVDSQNFEHVWMDSFLTVYIESFNIKMYDIQWVL